MKTIFENYAVPIGEGSFGVQLKYRSCDPSQNTTTGAAPNFRVTVERIDGLGLEQEDAIFAMDRLLDQMRIKRRYQRLIDGKADA